MKKVKFNGKLSLNKETITSLNHIQMQEINGGATEMFHSRLLCQSSNQETRNKCCTLEGTTSNMGGGCN
jgi:hypothetical protein